ncbi:YlcI/YnfO family protein, partial [Yersinia enterocolitica]
MATGSKNAKSQSLTARIPHDVMEGMESVKQDGESNAGFIVAAMRGEIARRQ